MHTAKNELSNPHSANFVVHTGRQGWWRRRTRKQRILLLVGIAVVLLIISAIRYRVAAYALYGDVQEGKQAFEKSKARLTEKRFGAAAEHLNEGVRSFADARKELKKMGALRWVPLVARQVNAVDNLLQVGVQAGTAASSLAALADHVLAPLDAGPDVTFANIAPAEKRSILESVSQSTPEIQGAKAQMDLAVQFLDKIPEHGLLGPIAKAVEPLRTQVPQFQDLLDKSVPMAQVLPAMLGYPEKRSYLFLLQNNTELRPTGGFIGTYGIVHFQDGEIDSFTTHNVYELDDPAHKTLFIEAPAPLQKYLKAEYWYFRDSNWSPDFPTAAREALRFYELESGSHEPFQGVIAVTPAFIASLPWTGSHLPPTILLTRLSSRSSAPSCNRDFPKRSAKASLASWRRNSSSACSPFLRKNGARFGQCSKKTLRKSTCSCTSKTTKRTRSSKTSDGAARCVRQTETFS